MKLMWTTYGYISTWLHLTWLHSNMATTSTSCSSVSASSPEPLPWHSLPTCGAPPRAVSSP
ncbi:hypothetical protein PR003_g14832 [Phytophthora rubi]|uniref:Uncharacterized protein n=1 Tax=Phytophthora rubi TaxID=129364 RepID=A0A6A4ETN9_9STRA|nr:hypothetical protein PR002_g18363 [Phytophthora rubi]KAE9005346.1 hypothetical protein PR001_g17472 [Phytophthora rubi]KAE9331801.1 hypothetical protein PR003_g14832 [Phytophthora rubi]